MSKKRRILTVDIARALAIITVLMGHVVDSDTMYKTVIYSFHMPLFFFLSGFVMKQKDTYTVAGWQDFLFKKICTIYFPYMLWGLIYAQFSFKHLAYLLYGTRETLLAAVSLSSLWFLPVLLVAAVIVEFIGSISVRLVKQRALITAFAGLCCLIVGFLLPHHHKYGDPLGIDIAFVAAGFMLFGQLLKNFHEKKLLHLYWIQVLCCVCSLGGMILFFLFVKSEGYVLMANAVYGNVLWFLLTSVLGICFVMSLSALIAKIAPKQKLLPYIGCNTMGIFILHKPFVELMKELIVHFGYSYNTSWIIILITFITLCIVVPLLYLMNRFTPFMFGHFQIERKSGL